MLACLSTLLRDRLRDPAPIFSSKLAFKQHLPPFCYRHGRRANNNSNGRFRIGTLQGSQDESTTSGVGLLGLSWVVGSSG